VLPTELSPRFNVPGSGRVKGSGQGTYPVGINPRGGEIVGSYQDENYLYHAFLRAANGKTFTIIDSPGAGTESNQGTIGPGHQSGGYDHRNLH
jgi:hypothetical protein